MPGLPRFWAPPGQHFIITHYTVLSGSLSKFLLPLLGLWAYSLCLRDIYERSNVAFKLFLRKFIFVVVVVAVF